MAVSVLRMPPANMTQGTPAWWVHVLAQKQNLRLRDLKKYAAYYDGDQDLSFATQKFIQHFGGLFKEFADNICQVVVQAMVERMKVQGISFSTTGEREGDPQRAYDVGAWEMWQRNNLDAWSQVHHTQLATTGYGYVIVWGDNEDQPVISVEDPLQMIVAHSAEAPRRRVAALKRWVDEWTGHEHATLYLPEAVHKFKSQQPTQQVGSTNVPAYDVSWVPRSDDSVIENPLGVVPVIEFLNDPTVNGLGRSEIRAIVPIQDAINKIIADMIIASEYGAYRQRYAIGLEVETDEGTGKPKKPFEAAIERVWTSNNENAKFGEFEATDLSNYVKAKESLLQDSAFISRTPRHYFTQSGQSPSGDALKSSETGLVAKVKDREVPAGESWEEVTRLGYLVQGDKAKAAAWDAEVKWADPEYRTEGELTDAIIKQHGAGLIPWEYAVDRLGYSPQDIEKMRKMRAVEMVQRAAANLSDLLTTPEPEPQQ